MENPNGRLFTRVEFKRFVQLVFGAKVYKNHAIKDLSLGGMYVEGDFEQKIGETCVITLVQEGPASTIDLQTTGRIIRVADDGIALKFISMKFDSFLFLQTTLLYEADDPTVLGREFLRDFSFNLESDD